MSDADAPCLVNSKFCLIKYLPNLYVANAAIAAFNSPTLSVTFTIDVPRFTKNLTASLLRVFFHIVCTALLNSVMRPWILLSCFSFSAIAEPSASRALSYAPSRSSTLPKIAASVLERFLPAKSSKRAAWSMSLMSSQTCAISFSISYVDLYAPESVKISTPLRALTLD